MANETHLAKGYRIFRDKTFVEFKDRYREIAKDGQSPKSMVITCSDSRMSAEVIFNAEPGELFVVRNVAGLVPPCEESGAYHGTSAALEFAVKHLKVENVVVLGHTHCGGIAAALAMPDKPDNFIDSWIEIIRDSRDALVADDSHDCKIEALEKAAIKQSLSNLKTFDFVDDAILSGQLTLTGCLIDIATGDLQVYESHNNTWHEFE